MTADPVEARRLYALSAERGNEEAGQGVARGESGAGRRRGGRQACGRSSTTAWGWRPPESRRAAPSPQIPAGTAPAPKP